MTKPILEIDLKMSLDRFDLELAFQSSSRSLGVFGPSGSGKTTFLETLAGLRPAASGRIICQGELWLESAANRCVPAERRGIGYVPQDHLLFPHWNVRRNLQAGFRRAAQTGRDPSSVFEDVVRVLELKPLLECSVNELSGGERQRVSLGRAICSGPKLLLLDEPLASLDLALRRRILPFLLRARDVFDIPMLVVSHNPAELLALCDEVVALETGRLIAQGSPAETLARSEVYASAATDGFENMLSGVVATRSEGEQSVQIGGQSISLASSGQAEGDRVLVGIRSQDILVAKERIRGTSARNWLSATVKTLQAHEGKRVLIATLDQSAGEAVVELTRDAAEELSLSPGVPVWLFFKSSAASVYGSSDTGVRQ